MKECKKRNAEKSDGEEDPAKGWKGKRQCRTGRNKRIRASSVASTLDTRFSTVACMRAHTWTLFMHAYTVYSKLACA